MHPFNGNVLWARFTKAFVACGMFPVADVTHSAPDTCGVFMKAAHQARVEKRFVHSVDLLCLILLGRA